MKRALTSSQAAELLRAANLLPPAARDPFIGAVDRRLAGIPHRLNDGDVQSAIVAVLGDTDTRVTTPMFCNDAVAQNVPKMEPNVPPPQPEEKADG